MNESIDTNLTVIVFNRKQEILNLSVNKHFIVATLAKITVLSQDKMLYIQSCVDTEETD